MFNMGVDGDIKAWGSQTIFFFYAMFGSENSRKIKYKKM